ncbi:TetR family transcriptional regulator [Aquihabitans sp. G128]|uniref:TetR family transcriptional regulator n=1 Tax=Aquihabitans sp. G128 TaxID=2849779 RepID=UPI001C241AC5|nr:TetR family transcriptional regulator [Aquihabitans sp. G128]QXC62917.1 TetR family transcriptional regulator [Aquihabitans sp. G128]
MDVEPATLTKSQAARRERVIRAALDLGASGGYDSVQMRDVATSAGVALGTIYRYFSSKDHLLAAAMVEWTHDLERRVGQRPPKGDTTAERVGDVLRRATRAMEKEPKLSESVVTALLSPDRGAASCQEDVSASMTRILSMALGDDFDPAFQAQVTRTLGHVWFSSLIGWVNGWSGFTKVSDELDLATHLVLDQYDR